MVVPTAAIEFLIIKFDLCVCFDYFSVLTSEAPGPWGICQSPTLVGNTCSRKCVCLCFECMCLLR